METQAQNLAGGVIVPEVPTLQEVPNEIATIEGGKKCKKGSRKGSDGKCHRTSKPKMKLRGYSKSRGGLCGSVGMKLCKMSPQCQYVRGHAKKGSKPARKGYCKSRPMEESLVDSTIQNLFQGGTADLEAGRRSSRRLPKGSHAKAVARANKLCVKASGKTSTIRQRIKSAKKSKKATAKRCARK